MPDISISQLANTNSVNSDDLFEISKNLGGDSYESRSVNLENLRKSIQSTEVITVNKDGTGDSATVEEAITLASSMATQLNPVEILVYPGVYYENNPLLLPSFVSLISSGGPFVTAIAPNNADKVIEMGSRSYVQGITIQTPDVVGSSGVVGFFAENNLCIIENCVVVNCEEGFCSYGSSAKQTFVLNSATLNYSTTSIDKAFVVYSGGVLVLKNCLTNSSDNNINYGIYCDGDGSVAYVSSMNFSECNDAIYCDNGGYIKCGSTFIYDCLNGLHIGSNGNNSRIIVTGCDIDNGTVTNKHLIIESVTGHIDFIGQYDAYKRSIVDGAELHSIAQDESIGGSSFEGNVHVSNRLDIGNNETRNDLTTGSDIGTGRSYNVDDFGNEVVEYWAYDASAPSGSRFSRYNNNAGTQLEDDGDAIVIGSRYYFAALKLDITQAMNTGSSSIITEHWNGSGWTEHDVATYSRDDFEWKGQSFFQDVETQYVEHGYEIYNDNWTVADNVLDEIPAWDIGIDLYPIRFRVNGGSLTTACSFENGKVKGDNFSVQASGQTINWGNNRGLEIEFLSSDNISDDPVNPPSTENIQLSANVYSVNAKVYANNTTSAISQVIELPEYVDTSSKMKVGMGGPFSNSNTGSMVFNYYVVGLVGSVDNGSISEDVYTVLHDAPGIANRNRRLDQYINIAHFSPAQRLAIKIERDGTNPLDTYNGDWKQHGMCFQFRRKIVG